MTTVHDLFAEQVRTNPAGSAVTFERSSLTYEELDRAADRVGREIHLRGAAPDTVVGILLPRSLHMVAGVLGVLKTGAAYVPLDPAFPQDRIDYLVQDAGMSLIVTNRHMWRDRLRDRRVVFVEELDAAMPLEWRPHANASNPDNVACIIYTAGSRGRRIGVQIPHRSIVNVLESIASISRAGADDVLLAVTPLSLGGATLELLLPLVTGGRVVVAPEAAANNGAALRQAITDAVTMMHARPHVWETLLASGWSGGPRLKAWCSGQVMPRALADQLLERCSDVWFAFGAVETAMCSTAHLVKSGQGPVPIGRPIANTSARVLDENLQPMPSGQSGELYIGGAGLARGYLNKPDLTAERFMRDASDPHANARLFRTGDLARMNEEGEFEWLGRRDRQVTIAGYTIEPREVEAALEEYAVVRQAVVCARRRSGGADTQLVAYLVVRVAVNDLAGTLRRHLAYKLPPFMVPSAFIVVDALPTTADGAIDYDALPQTRAQPTETRMVMPPRRRAGWTSILTRLRNVSGAAVQDEN